MVREFGLFLEIFRISGKEFADMAQCADLAAENHQVPAYYLGILQDRGFRVALVTDGRMSGASGKVPAAIHLSPEALSGGPISKVRDGDLLRLNASTGELTALVPADEWRQPESGAHDNTNNEYGTGRELFAHMRNAVNEAESGATIFQPYLLGSHPAVI